MKRDSTQTKKRPRTEWRIYPSKKRPTFRNGDLVFVKSKDGKSISKGRIYQTNDTTKQENFKDNNSVSVIVNQNNLPILLNQKEQRKRLLPHFDDSSPKILVTPETNFFRSLTSQVETTDKILEIGCSTGETARLVIPHCKSYIGFDTSDEMIAQCEKNIQLVQEKHKKTACHDYHLVKVDALIDPMKAKKEALKFGSPNVIFLDIGGNRERINVLRMISWVLDTFHSRLVIVKSRELTQSIRSSASVTDTGLIENGNDWFDKRKQQRKLPKHPLRAPLVLSPKDGETPICRYHNYRICGKKEACPYDHEHCHACLQPGHIALQCPTLIPFVPTSETKS